jgi:VWFA-related protein
MWRAFLVSIWLQIILALAASAAPPPKPFIECNPEELVRAIPELAGMQFDSNQDRLPSLLRGTGETLSRMFAKLAEVSAKEDINELRFDVNMGGTNRREVFRYAIRPHPDGGPAEIEEFRMDAATRAHLAPPASDDFLILSNFVQLLNYLRPGSQELSSFRYLGRSKAAGSESSVVAFLPRPQVGGPIPLGPNDELGIMQGVAWIDTVSGQIVRLRTDLLQPGADVPFQTLTIELSLAPVTFKAGGIFSLPAKVTVDASFSGGEVHSVHRYSDYESAGVKGAEARISTTEDAYEILARGLVLLHGKPATAIPVFRQALRLNPQLPSARFNLANALFATGNTTDAEVELREVLRLDPESGVAHNFLGIILAKRGDVAGAIAEFRASLQFQPKASTVHFNLAQSLEKSGDRKAALDEYRTASELAPDNPGFKLRYEQFNQAANLVPVSETTIKLDVRQVLVPVVVTNKEGHHVTGLKRGDFRVFEDGIEQKLSGFSVDDTTLNDGSVSEGGATPELAGSAAHPPAANPKPAAVRRTYVICIDSLHSAAANITSVREALLKLFRSENAEDSRYIVVAAGTSTELVRSATSDPKQVLQAIESKAFEKIWITSRRDQRDADMLAFRKRLDDIRAACDTKDVLCLDKGSLPAQAKAIAAEDRIRNLSFLSQFRSVVEQLAHGNGAQTIVLISDGFQLVPGKEAYDLTTAYFPEFKSSLPIPASDRMQELDPILHLAANNNIPIYTIDSRGLYTSSFFSASNPSSLPRMSQQVSAITTSTGNESGDTLAEIAAATGGTTFHNSNDLLTGLKRAFADGRQYYMLAYVPANANQDGTFRTISVTVRDPKMVVKAKRGYWASSK